MRIPFSLLLVGLFAVPASAGGDKDKATPLATVFDAFDGDGDAKPVAKGEKAKDKPGQGADLTTQVEPKDGDKPKDEVVKVPERTNPVPPVVVEHEQAAQDALQRGDTRTAIEHIQAARQVAPEDQKLAVMEKLLVRRVQQQDPNLLQKKFNGFLNNRVDSIPEPEAQQGPIMATPIAFTAARAGAPEIAMGKARDPFHPDAAHEAANKLRLRDFSGAEASLTEKINEDPENWQALRNRAFVRLQLKRPHDALADAKRADELKPSDSSVLVVLGMALRELLELRAAVDVLTRAIQADPKNAKAYNERSLTHGLLGDKASELADMKQAAELDRAFEEAYAQLQSGGRRGLMPRFTQKTAALYGGAASLALLFISYALFRRRSPESVATTRPPMRLEDRLGGKMPEVPHGFTLVRQVGQGGMGVVYEATDSVLQRRVALKKMRPEIAVDPRERRRFLKEARIVAGLKHPHIVEIHQVIENEESLYLVFEFVEGQNLSEVVDAEPLSPAAALRLGRQIAEALDYAHAHGVIHQDLKPSNVMVAAGYAKVMDFGIARSLNHTMSTMTRNQVVGTPAYMAPEQEQSMAVPASDQYALALCLYEMLSGRMAYPVNATVFQKLERQYQPLSDGGKVAPVADAVIGRALDPDPSKRFASASAFIAELERSLLPS